MTLNEIAVVVGKMIINCPHCGGVCRVGKAVIRITVDEVIGFLCPTKDDDYPCPVCERMICDVQDDEKGMVVAFDSQELAEQRANSLLDLWNTDQQTFLEIVTIVPEDAAEPYTSQ